MSKKNKLLKSSRQRRKIAVISQNNVLQFKKLVKQFKKLKEEILRDRECSKCGICCNTFKIKLTQKDIDIEPRLVENSILMTKEEIKRYKLKYNVDYIRFLKHVNEGSRRCIFYDEEIGCKIHSTKPAECVAYTPSFGHCKETEVKSYCDLTVYFNKHQKAYIEGIEKCGVGEKIQKLIMLINAFIIPFITKCDNKGFVEPDYGSSLPSFVKECFKEDGYQVVGDLPMIRDSLSFLYFAICCYSKQI